MADRQNVGAGGRLTRELQAAGLAAAGRQAKRAAASQLLGLDRAVHAAACGVVVDDAGRLHERVGGRRPDEAEAALLELLGQRGRLGARGDVVGPRARRLVRLRAEAPEERRQGAVLFDHGQGGAGVRDRRLDLEPVAHDAGVGEQALAVVVAERGDGGDVEAGERRPERRPLAQDRQPRQAGLERLEGEALEQRRRPSRTGRPHSSSW